MPAIGIDIGTTSIKAVQLEKTGGGYRLIAAGVTSTPQGGMVADNEQTQAVVAEAVKKVLSDTKITGKNVSLSLPQAKIFTRIVKLPYLSDQEIDSAVSWQAEPYIPIPLPDASLDYQVLRRIEPANGKPGEVDVLLVAAPKALVAKYMKVAELVGLSVDIIQPDLTCLAKSIAPVNQTSIVVDIGASGTGIAVVDKGQLYISHSIPTGGSVFTRAVAASFNVSQEQAEEYKKAYGLSDQLEGKIQGVLTPIIKVIVDEIKKAVQYYKTEISQEGQVASCVLAGGSAGLPGLVPYLAENLGMEVLIGDPFSRLVKDERIAKSFSAFAPLYGVATGLAMAT